MTAGWHNKKSLTYLSALLNRNPQDMIYKLLEYCEREGLKFTQKERSQGTKNWDSKVENCAAELFAAGLPAWKIAVIFETDFEHVEKVVFLKRNGYGHKKQNPFSINTDHKQLVNDLVLSKRSISINRALELYAGEGRFTKRLLELKELRKLYCVEKDETTFKSLKNNIMDGRVDLISSDNEEVVDRFKTGDFDLVDVDPFVTCYTLIPQIWSMLSEEAFVFFTFGGEYRRSFISSNRKSIFTRYGFFDEQTSNKDYLEIVPTYFLGNVAYHAAQNGYEFDVIRAVRYANNCRFWLKASRSHRASEWLSTKVVSQNGHQYLDFDMPRFKEVRYELNGQGELI